MLLKREPFLILLTSLIGLLNASDTPDFDPPLSIDGNPLDDTSFNQPNPKSFGPNNGFNGPFFNNNNNNFGNGGFGNNNNGFGNNNNSNNFGNNNGIGNSNNNFGNNSNNFGNNGIGNNNNNNFGNNNNNFGNNNNSFGNNNNSFGNNNNSFGNNNNSFGNNSFGNNNFGNNGVNPQSSLPQQQQQQQGNIPSPSPFDLKRHCQTEKFEHPVITKKYSDSTGYWILYTQILETRNVSNRCHHNEYVYLAHRQKAGWFWNPRVNSLVQYSLGEPKFVSREVRHPDRDFMRVIVNMSRNYSSSAADLDRIFPKRLAREITHIGGDDTKWSDVARSSLPILQVDTAYFQTILPRENSGSQRLHILRDDGNNIEVLE